MPAISSFLSFPPSLTIRFMASLSAVWKLRTLPLLFAFALAGCNHGPTASEQSAQPTPSPGPVSAIPTSFAQVTSQLDAGGDLYIYFSTAQWLANLSSRIASLHDLVLSGSGATQMTDEQRAQVDQVTDLLKDILHRSGIEQLSGVGASSIALTPTLYRSKSFFAYGSSGAAMPLWQLYGKEPHPLDAPSLFPADTAAASLCDFDLPLLINSIRHEAARFPASRKQEAQAETQFATVTGLQVDQTLNSLGDSIGMVLTLDGTATVTLPIQGADVTIPKPRLAILFATRSDLIFKQLDKFAGAMPGLVKADAPGLSMRTTSVPILPGLTLRPTIAQWNQFLVIATDDQLVRDMIAVHDHGAPGLASTPLYTSLAAGLPAQGNAFSFVTRRLTDTIRSMQTQMIAAGPGTAPSQAALMKRILGSFEKGRDLVSVGVQSPTGFLTISQGSEGLNQMLAPIAILPAAMIAGAALPAFEKAHERSQETASMIKEKQIAQACIRYAHDHSGSFPTALEDLFPNYLQDRSILVSPLMPSQPYGYTYVPPIGTPPDAASVTVILTDAFGAIKHRRIVAYADGSAQVLPAP